MQVENMNTKYKIEQDYQGFKDEEEDGHIVQDVYSEKNNTQEQNTNPQTTDRYDSNQIKPPYIGSIDDLPKWMVDNEFILSGCRINFQGWRGVFRTLFMCHNETFNIWSHYLGFLMFAGMVVYVLVANQNIEALAKEGQISQDYMVKGQTQSFLSFINMKSQDVTKDLDKAEINFVQNYQANKQLQIEDVTSAKASQVKLFSAKISSEIESLSYLFVEDIRNKTGKPDIDGAFFSISSCIISFKEFIRKYQTVSDNKNAFSSNFSRMTILHKGLYEL